MSGSETDSRYGELSSFFLPLPPPLPFAITAGARRRPTAACSGDGGEWKAVRPSDASVYVSDTGNNRVVRYCAADIDVAPGPGVEGTVVAGSGGTGRTRPPPPTGVCQA